MSPWRSPPIRMRVGWSRVAGRPVMYLRHEWRECCIWGRYRENTKVGGEAGGAIRIPGHLQATTGSRGVKWETHWLH
eukprot:scaffold173748_cov25-Prasinocladus_malaysianus.AAC.1